MYLVNLLIFKVKFILIYSLKIIKEQAITYKNKRLLYQIF